MHFLNFFENLDIALISASNPSGIKVSSKKNKESTIQFAKELEKGHYDYFIFDGNYKGLQEKTFLIYKISNKKAKELSKKYKQEAYVYGTLQGNKLRLNLYKNGKLYGNKTIEINDINNFKNLRI